MKQRTPALGFTDSYKLSHDGFTPEDLNEVFSNGTPRFYHYFKRKYPDFEERYVAFGTQYMVTFVKDLFDEFFTADKEKEINRLKRVFTRYIGLQDYTRFENLHDLGYLPIEIKALPEGALVKFGVPLFTIRNTHPDFDWLTNYLETLLSLLIWKPLTVANISREFYKLSMKFSEETCDDTSHVKFQNHDFSERGQDGCDSDEAVGMAWLTHSIGTDNTPGVFGADYYYKGEDCGIVGLSVPASEHAVVTLNIINNAVKAQNKDPKDIIFTEQMMKEGETEFLKDVLQVYYPTGIVSSVFDSYDYWRALTEILPEIKEIIMNRDGKLVVRPDSGDPCDVVCGTLDIKEYETLDMISQDHELFDHYASLPGKEFTVYAYILSEKRYYEVKYTRYNSQNLFERKTISLFEPTPEEKGSIRCLWEIFGGTINSKGYKVLDPHIGLIYGDGINYLRANEIFERLKAKGFASSNVVYGVGSFSLHLSSRDDLGFAIKATHCKVGNLNLSIFKDPKTDSSKKSAKGYLFVYKDENGEYNLESDVSFEKHMSNENMLQTILLNGEYSNQVSLDDIRRDLGVDLFM